MTTQTKIDTQEVFFENGTIWVPTTSSWSGKDRLNASDIGKTEEEILDIIELGRKKILPEETRVKLGRPRSQVTGLMMRYAKPFFMRGAWFVPNKNFLKVKEGLEDIKKNQDAIVQDLIDNMDEIKSEMIAEYSMLEDANWPTDDTIRRRFRLSWHVIEVSGSSIQEADSTELAEAKILFSKQLRETYDEYKDQIMQDAQLAIIEACMDISEKIKSGSKFTATSLKKPKKVIDDYMSIATVFDLEEVRAEVNKVKVKLDATDPANIRNNWSYAKDFAGSMQTMAENIGDLSGLSANGMVKRVVKRRKAA